MRSRSCWAGVAALAAGLIFVTGGGAAATTTVTLTVNSKVDSQTPCTIAHRKSLGTCTLRGAILAANAVQEDNTMFVIKLPAKIYRLVWGPLTVAAGTANTGNIVRIAGAVKKVGKRKHKRTVPGALIDGSYNAKPASVFVIDSPTQMFNVVIAGGSGNPSYVCENGGGGCGGGVFVDAALDLENSIVRSNTACSAYTDKTCTGTYVRGGGIYVADDNVYKLLTLSKTTVMHNVAGQGGGIDNENAQHSTVLITSSHIDNNTACDTFANRVCIGAGNGGGIYNGGEQLTLDQSTVSGNTAGSPADDEGDGGGIYQGSDNLQLDHTTVSGNVAGHQGGGVYDGGQADFVSSSVSHNSAGAGGGGVYVSAHAAFSGTTLASNTAGGTFECTIRVTKTACKHSVKATTRTCAALYRSATQCTSNDGDGGGILNAEQYPELIRTTVSNNLAASISGDAKDCGGGQGGGIWASWPLSVIDGSKVTGNTADCGGGLYNVSGGTGGVSFDLANSTMSGNRALEDGGAVWTTGTDTGVLYGMTITKNHAGRQTGGVWDDQLGAVLLGAGDTIAKNTSRGACKNVTLPCS